MNNYIVKVEKTEIGGDNFNEYGIPVQTRVIEESSCDTLKDAKKAIRAFIKKYNLKRMYRIANISEGLELSTNF